MIRRELIPVLMVLLFSCLISTTVPAEETGTDQDSNTLAAEETDASQSTQAEAQKEWEKLGGKELYRMRCKSCHEEDSPNGEYTPMALIQEQWERFFDEQYLETHTEVADSTQGNIKVVELITDKMLEKINKFCIDGAADSEHPMTCQ